MPSSADLRRRLQRAGVKARRKPEPAAGFGRKPPSRPGHGGGIETLVPGRAVGNAFGTCYLIEKTYPLDHPHGPGVLGDFLHQAAALAAEVARDSALAGADLGRLAFLDTETTGLSGGAGTFAFLVGIGTFEHDHFHLRQYFLRDPAEEKAMLSALLNDLAVGDGLVTFNGRNFDLPLLDARLTIALRRRERLGRRPHLDLLHPARRLWRGRLPSCALSSLETHALQVKRSSRDVPGALIPGMYLGYLRTGDAREMPRVIYHNAVDILSLVSLAAYLLQAYARPLAGPAAGAIAPAEALALARWHEMEGGSREAEAGYRQALAGELPEPERSIALTRLAALLKRAGRRAEALPHWQALTRLAPDDPRPDVELAKYYEWEAHDFVRAARWTRMGLAALSRWQKGWRRDEARAALEHRLARLQRKLERD